MDMNVTFNMMYSFVTIKSEYDPYKNIKDCMKRRILIWCRMSMFIFLSIYCYIQCSQFYYYGYIVEIKEIPCAIFFNIPLYIIGDYE